MCFLSLPLAAEDAAERIRMEVVAVSDGATFRLADGREVRLAGIAAAKAVTASAMDTPPPIVTWANRVLEELLVGRKVELELVSRRIDRHRRLLAHVYVVALDAPGGGRTWVQGELLRQGTSRVATTLDTRRFAAEMLAIEAEARADGRGIWALDYHRTLTPGEAASGIGSFRLVQGRVREVNIVGGRAYLNFGDDWRSDFTVSLGAPARRLFHASGLEPETLAGRVVRVRGWIESYNGPMIEVTHPEEVEVSQE